MLLLQVLPCNCCWQLHPEAALGPPTTNAVCMLHMGFEEIGGLQGFAGCVEGRLRVVFAGLGMCMHAKVRFCFWGSAGPRFLLSSAFGWW